MSERDEKNREDQNPREDPARPPRPSVVSVNRRPLYTVGIAILFVLFVLLAYLNPRPTTPRDRPKAPPSADPNSILGRFLAEQESRARAKASQPPSAPRPPVFSGPSSPSFPPPLQPPDGVAGSATPADPALAGNPPIPGVYDPRWPSFLVRGGASPDRSQEARTTPVPDRPVIRYRSGEKSPAPPADPVVEALARLLPKAEEAPASSSRQPETLPVPVPSTPRDRGEAFLAPRPVTAALQMRPSPSGGSQLRLLAGSLIPATLETAVHSDLPGLVTALVRRDTYDSATGRYLLIPRGARLVGEYSSETQHGDSRLLLAWTRLLLPDGTSYDLARMPASDLAGASGLPAQVNNHWGRLFGSALLLSVISAGVQLSQAPSDSDLRRSSPTASEVASGALGQELGQVSTGLLRRELDLRPSLSLPAGTPFNVQVATDLEFQAPYARVRP